MGENVTKSSKCSDLGNLKVENEGTCGCLGVLAVDDHVDSDDREELEEDSKDMKEEESLGME